MITELKIENYKSIHDLTLEVGRVNVLIGENGCGKSNILEAITFAAAAEANKLDNEFLLNRGIRVTEPKLMRSAFFNNNQYIKIMLKLKGYDFSYTLFNDNTPYSKWDYIEDGITRLKRALDAVAKRNKNSTFDINKLARKKFKDKYTKKKFSNHSEIGNQTLLKKDSFSSEIKNFIIFSPENSTLRNFEKKAEIEPLGINGEGLFKLLTVIQNEAKESGQAREELNDIKEALELFGWYEEINIPDDYRRLDKNITIKDRYLEIPFDQRSANEGFLLVLFYITLVVSKYTPKIFAIDNIDTSLNPKLCTKLIKELARLAKKYDKQLFVTSHNPAILDGIDLADDEQRLFVVSRNKQGHTRCKRIEEKDEPKSSVRDRLSRVFNDNQTYTKEDILNKFDNSEEPLKLSYALLRGYLGGLPKNF
jgi:predicted ATPase